MALYALIILLVAVGLTGFAALALVVLMVIRTTRENGARVAVESPISTEPIDTETIDTEPIERASIAASDETVPITGPATLTVGGDELTHRVGAPPHEHGTKSESK